MIHPWSGYQDLWICPVTPFTPFTPVSLQHPPSICYRGISIRDRDSKASGARFDIIRVDTYIHPAQYFQPWLHHSIASPFIHLSYQFQSGPNPDGRETATWQTAHPPAPGWKARKPLERCASAVFSWSGIFSSTTAPSWWER